MLIAHLNCSFIIHLIVAHSLRNKFDLFTELVEVNIDVLIISETKLDSSFPEGQFRFPTTFRRDRDQFGRAIMIFVREDISSKLLPLETARTSLYVELKFRKKKWLLNCVHNPNRNNISNHLNELR